MKQIDEYGGTYYDITLPSNYEDDVEEYFRRSRFAAEALENPKSRIRYLATNGTKSVLDSFRYGTTFDFFEGAFFRKYYPELVEEVFREKQRNKIILLIIGAVLTILGGFVIYSNLSNIMIFFKGVVKIILLIIGAVLTILMLFGLLRGPGNFYDDY